jgi:hypothetical protein
MIAVTAEKLRHLPQGSEMPSMGPGRVNIREVMRSSTAVLASAGVRGAHEYQRTCWSDNPSGLTKTRGDADLVADQRYI